MTAATNRRLVWIGVPQLVVFVLQLLVFGYQARATDDQSKDMKESIAQATRAAAATEKVAVNMAVSAKAANDRYSAKAAILAIPLPSDFSLPPVAADLWTSDA